MKLCEIEVSLRVSQHTIGTDMANHLRYEKSGICLHSIIQEGSYDDILAGNFPWHFPLALATGTDGDASIAMRLVESESQCASRAAAQQPSACSMASCYHRVS